MEGVIEVDHPLVRHHLTILRNKTTPPALFRQQARRLASLLAYGATSDLPLRLQVHIYAVGQDGRPRVGCFELP